MENQTQLPINQPVSETVIQAEQMPKKGNFLVILLSVLLLVSVSIAGFFAFQTQRLNEELRMKNGELKQPTQNTIDESSNESVPTVIPDTTSNWLKFESKDGLVLKYPPEWTVVNNMYISQKSFDPYSTSRRSGIYNVIEIHKFTSKLVADQTNKEWFTGITTGPEVVTEQGVTRTVVESGKVETGESYLVTKKQASVAVDQIRAYIIKAEVLYEIVLSDYDLSGLEYFKLIMRNAIVL